jgi:cAMP-specific phosphodiesterase 4
MCVRRQNIAFDMANGNPTNGSTSSRSSTGENTNLPFIRASAPPVLRRESFLFRSELDTPSSAAAPADLSPGSRQRPATQSSIFDNHLDETIVTPFAQLLSSLHAVRTNFMVLTNLSTSRSRRRSAAFQKDDLSHSSPTGRVLSDIERQALATETLDELERCLDQLENIQTHRSVGHMAAHKFRQVLNRELSQYAGMSKSGQRVSAFITQTFLDQDTDYDKFDDTDSDSAIVPMTNKHQQQPAGTHRLIQGGSRAQHIGSFGMTNGSTQMTDTINKFGVVPSNEPQLVEHIQNVDMWGIDLFQIAHASNNRPLTSVVYTILQRRDLIHKLKLPNRELVAYLARVEDHYRSNVPYHNSLHGADVAQSSHVLLNLPTLRNVFTDIEIFSTLIAATVHDVDHPGLNNQFLINSGSELSLIYNDQSVLENHHLSVAFKLLQKDGCEVMQNFSQKKFQNIRRMIIDLVLATDMCKHMEHVAHLRTRLEVRKLTEESGNVFHSKLALESYGDRIQILQSVVHCSDLSNPTKPREVYKQWTERITEEFFRQGDKERQLGFEVSPMCDRHTVSVPSNQIAFIDYVVYPLWETWANLIYPDCQPFLETLEANREYQQAIHDREQSEPDSNLKPTSVTAGVASSH